MSESEESALIVSVPSVEPLVSGLRAEFDRSARRGAPAHITLLYPFRHPDLISDEVESVLEAFFAHCETFSFTLAGICGFPGVVYLVPEPLEAFDEISNRLRSRFPDTPPYGGVFNDPVPHLTVAHPTHDTDLPAISGTLLDLAGPRLPLECTADRATLLLKRRGFWQPRRVFPFATT